MNKEMKHCNHTKKDLAGHLYSYLNSKTYPRDFHENNFNISYKDLPITIEDLLQEANEDELQYDNENENYEIDIKRTETKYYDPVNKNEKCEIRQTLSLEGQIGLKQNANGNKVFDIESTNLKYENSLHTV